MSDSFPRRLQKPILTFKLALSERWSVASNNDELSLSRSKSLEGGLVTEGDCEQVRCCPLLTRGKIAGLTFARLHHKRQARVDGIGGLLGLLWCHRNA